MAVRVPDSTRCLDLADLIDLRLEVGDDLARDLIAEQLEQIDALASGDGLECGHLDALLHALNLGVLRDQLLGLCLPDRFVGECTTVALGRGQGEGDDGEQADCNLHDETWRERSRRKQYHEINDQNRLLLHGAVHLKLPGADATTGEPADCSCGLKAGEVFIYTALYVRVDLGRVQRRENLVQLHRLVAGHVLELVDDRCDLELEQRLVRANVTLLLGNLQRLRPELLGIVLGFGQRHR
uniref:Uncharacterized protein n=1 Tax=Anopheles farauti TaxID=69004 RepID=A0A182QYL8_9DIPT